MNKTILCLALVLSGTATEPKKIKLQIL